MIFSPLIIESIEKLHVKYYSKGEITKEELDNIMKVLKN